MTGTDVRNMLAKKLKLLRTEKGLSQAQLAEKAEISIPFLSAIERGTKWPYPETLAKLAEALNAEISDLFSSGIKSGNDKTYAADIIKSLLESQQRVLHELSERFLK